MTPAEREIAEAYRRIDKVLQPLVKGDGAKREVEAARVAFGALNLLRQWARLGSAVHERKDVATAIRDGSFDASLRLRFGITPRDQSTGER